MSQVWDLTFINGCVRTKSCQSWQPGKIKTVSVSTNLKTLIINYQHKCQTIIFIFIKIIFWINTGFWIPLTNKKVVITTHFSYWWYLGYDNVREFRELNKWVVWHKNIFSSTLCHVFTALGTWPNYIWQNNCLIPPDKLM